MYLYAWTLEPKPKYYHKTGSMEDKHTIFDNRSSRMKWFVSFTLKQRWVLRWNSSIHVRLIGNKKRSENTSIWLFFLSFIVVLLNATQYLYQMLQCIWLKIMINSKVLTCLLFQVTDLLILISKFEIVDFSRLMNNAWIFFSLIHEIKQFTYFIYFLNSKLNNEKVKISANRRTQFAKNTDC